MSKCGTRVLLSFFIWFAGSRVNEMSGEVPGYGLVCFVFEIKSCTVFYKIFYFCLPLTRQMRQLSHTNHISLSDIHIRFSNVHTNVSVGISSDTENGYILSKHVHRPKSDPK